MKTKSFYLVGGGQSERNDRIIKVGEHNYCLIFGFYRSAEDAEQTFHYRKNYERMPTEEELRADIVQFINKRTDEAILNGFKWNGKPVYLSQENQMNFKAAYDLAVQLNGATLPIRFKLGEDADGKPVYHTFTTLSAFTDFYTKAISYVINCINAGWQEKDSIDYEKLMRYE